MLSQEKRESLEDDFCKLLDRIETNDEYIESLFIFSKIIGLLVNDFPEDERDAMTILVKNTIGGAKQP